ncbi:hypothetical protein RQP46_005484 [Phenoliferia psychrophenolica]
MTHQPAPHHHQQPFHPPARPHHTPPSTIPATPFAADLSKNVQGDVIIGLQKRVETFLFFIISSAAGFRHLLKSQIADHISTTGDVGEAQAKIDSARAHDANVWLPICHKNVAFSATGLTKLGINVSSDFAGANAFLGGMELDATANLADPQANNKLTTWKEFFIGKKIDGVFIVTAESQASLDTEVTALKHLLGATVAVVLRVDGNVRPGDGISVPTIKGFNDATRTPGTDAVDASVILTGQDAATTTWTKDGSFLTFRELQQLVPEFDGFVHTVAASFQPTVPGITAEAVGARIVGRWKSGAPVVLSPVKDDPVLGKDPQRNMDFDYTTDLGQVACKTNPRKGTAPATIPVDPHLIIRQGIPYGPEVCADEQAVKRTLRERGLLFACYQSSIENGFQFVQKLWANNPAFPFNNTAGIAAPGEDLIIGQVTTGARTAQGIKPNDATDPTNLVQSPAAFVVPRGGEYFFVPSIDALKNKLGA